MRSPEDVDDVLMTERSVANHRVALRQGRLDDSESFEPVPGPLLNRRGGALVPPENRAGRGDFRSETCRVQIKTLPERVRVNTQHYFVRERSAPAPARRGLSVVRSPPHAPPLRSGEKAYAPSGRWTCLPTATNVSASVPKPTCPSSSLSTSGPPRRRLPTSSKPLTPRQLSPRRMPAFMLPHQNLPRFW